LTFKLARGAATLAKRDRGWQSGVPGLEDSENASVRNLHCMATKGNSSQTSLSRENKLQVGDVWGGGWQKGWW